MAKTPIGDIVAGYDVMRNPVFRILITEGPFGLALEAGKRGYRLKDDYADKCHLCQEARTALLGQYPDILTPAALYRDPPPPSLAIPRASRRHPTP
jgi:hypothetical protein